ncbi:MAG TPA: tRNA (guanosine(37)-N1)-methyltransferase TrmD [Thermoanaerobaculia bacterium]|nr:tRNA (guanosine(37)-N1)-methyltransferase TrmD [Thermoanaerobaculia bacterium]
MITIFPELFDAFLRTSLVGRAVADRLLEVAVHDLRDYTDDPHRSVDDEPYGGGGGMVMTAPPWIAAVGAVSEGSSPWRIFLTPQGARLTDARVRELAERPHLVFLCGRYEGIDERVAQTVVDEEISIGDYVLAGGELAAMVVIEAVSRWIPGVVGLAASVESDSFRHGRLDHPHYTRPRVVAGIPVPEVLLSGDHRAIAEWRGNEAERRTRQRRPDLSNAAPCQTGDEEG